MGEERPQATETMQAQETVYSGVKYRSKLEAQWAYAFDLAGLDYEYEPSSFELKDGSIYIPDFKVDMGEGSDPLWVEVKGFMSRDDERKIAEFGATHPIVVVSGMRYTFKDYAEDERHPWACNAKYSWGKDIRIVPCIGMDGRFRLCSENDDVDFGGTRDFWTKVIKAWTKKNDVLIIPEKPEPICSRPGRQAEEKIADDVQKTKPAVTFDNKRYGRWLRYTRLENGFRKAGDFCSWLGDVYGLEINKECIYRLERGIQSPTMEQFVIFSKALQSIEGEVDLADIDQFVSVRKPDRLGSKYTEGIMTGHWKKADTDGEWLGYERLKKDWEEYGYYAEA